jgi:hypothetical protein
VRGRLPHDSLPGGFLDETLSLVEGHRRDRSGHLRKLDGQEGSRGALGDGVVGRCHG